MRTNLDLPADGWPVITRVGMFVDCGGRTRSFLWSHSVLVDWSDNNEGKKTKKKREREGKRGKREREREREHERSLLDTILLAS